MRAKRIRPTNPRNWPTGPVADEHPRLTGDIAVALYNSRMADQEREWVEIDRIMAENRQRYRMEKRARRMALEVERMEAEEAHDL